MPAEDFDDLVAAESADESQAKYLRFLNGDQALGLPVTADHSKLASALADLVIADLGHYPTLYIVK